MRDRYLNYVKWCGRMGIYPAPFRTWEWMVKKISEMNFIQ
jgi:hypothetical protein